MPPAEGTLAPVLKLREDVRVLFGQPGGNGGRGGAHNDGQPPGLGPGNHMVEEGEVKLPLRLFHQVPAKLPDADGVAAQLTDVVQVLLQHGGVPLLRIVVYAKKHYFSTLFALSCLEMFSRKLPSSL